MILFWCLEHKVNTPNSQNKFLRFFWKKSLHLGIYDIYKFSCFSECSVQDTAEGKGPLGCLALCLMPASTVYGKASISNQFLMALARDLEIYVHVPTVGEGRRQYY